MNQIAKETLREMKAQCPVESGELKRDLQIRGDGKYSVIVGSALPQMYFSNYGNKGKPIVPKKGKYMWFQSEKKYNLPKSDTGYYYAERVNPYEGKHWIEKVSENIRARYRR